MFAFDHSASAGRRSRTPGCCSKALPEQTTTFDVVTHSRGGLVLRNLVERANAVRRSRAPLQARSRGAGGVAERRHAAGDAETLGRHDRLDCQPARDVPGQPVHDGRGVRRQRPGVAGQSCVGRSSGSAFDGRRRRADRGDSESAGSACRRVFRAGRQLPADRRRCCSACWTSASISFSASANDLVVPSEGGWRIDRSSTDVHSGVADRLLRAGRQPAGRFSHPRQLFLAAGDRRTFSSTRCSAGNSR